ncbi:MAG TPA: class I SAM-dependent methyltransferase [Vicinamibacterales bacterium]|nr:class I SAM-dependent methyltransferase [Vicinamibacterales bacterium]
MSAAAWLRRALSHPLARDRDLDDPSTTALRRRIIAEKAPLADIYREWHAWLNRQLPSGGGRVLELGSGAGFMRDAIPRLIASDIFLVPEIDVVLDAQRLPFADESLRAIVMTNVLHHVPDVRLFFCEARRCVRPGGVVAMVEPWMTPWSSFVYRRLHHEPFAPDASDWTVGGVGPLSDANGALPWMVFERDRHQFEREFPEWRIASIAPQMPLRYLLSGGVSLRLLSPSWTFSMWNGLERILMRWPRRFAMFAGIALVKQ